MGSAQLDRKLLDLEALRHVGEVQDADYHDGVCPNWEIPQHIPTQRLSGLARRGYLGCANGRWWLTAEGVVYLNDLRETARWSGERL